jgi:hypothetical protein
LKSHQQPQKADEIPAQVNQLFYPPNPRRSANQSEERIAGIDANSANRSASDYKAAGAINNELTFIGQNLHRQHPGLQVCAPNHQLFKRQRCQSRENQVITLR